MNQSVAYADSQLLIILTLNMTVRLKRARSCRFILHAVVSCSWFQTAFVLSLYEQASRSLALPLF